MPDKTSLPDNVTLDWIAQNLVALRREIRELRSENLELRTDLRAFRSGVENAFTAVRADMSIVMDLIRNLRSRVEGLEDTNIH
jgi:hypothetical protein